MHFLVASLIGLQVELLHELLLSMPAVLAAIVSKHCLGHLEAPSISYYP